MTETATGALTPPKARTTTVEPEDVANPVETMQAEMPLAAPQTPQEATEPEAGTTPPKRKYTRRAGSKRPGRPRKGREGSSGAAKVVEVASNVVRSTSPSRSKSVPTAAEWEPWFTRGGVYLSVLYIWWLTDGEGDDKLEIDDERAEAIATPLARMWAKTSLNRAYGRDILENSDVIIAAGAMLTYLDETRPLFREKLARDKAKRMAKTDDNILSMRTPQTRTVHTTQGAAATRQAAAEKESANVEPRAAATEPDQNINGNGFTPGAQFESD